MFKLRHVAAVGAVAPSLVLAAETAIYGTGAAPAWSSVTWNPIAGINDGIDALSAAGDGRLDFVGDATDWGGYWGKDSSFLYVRARVHTPTYMAGMYHDSLHVLIDLPGVNIGTSTAGRPDYGFAWDSKSNNNATHGLEMQVLAINGQQWQQNRMDDIDGLDGQKGTRDINGLISGSSYRTGEGFVRAVDNIATTNFGTTTFIDFAVSWDYLQNPAKGNTQLTQSAQDWKIAFASIQNATDHNQLTGDISGGVSPTDPVTTGWSKSLNAPVVAVVSPVNGRVIRGGTGTLGASVDNAAPAGYNNLVYTVTPSTSAAGLVLGSVSPAPGALGPTASPVAHSFTVGTGASTAFGTNNVTITVADPNSSNGTAAATSALTVLDHSNAEFASPTGAATASMGANSLTLNFGTVRKGTNGGSLIANFNIVDAQSLLTTLANTAALDLDSIGSSGNTSTLSLLSGLTSFTNLAAGATQGYSFAFNTNTVGAFSATYTFRLSDENIAGGTAAGSEALTLTLAGTVVPVPEAGTMALAGVVSAPLLLGRRRIQARA